MGAENIITEVRNGSPNMADDVSLMILTAKTVSSIIPCSSMRGAHEPSLPPLPIFIADFIRRTHLSTTVILVALVYIERLQSLLPANARGEYGTRHRLFVAAALVASKYLNDTRALNSRYLEHKFGIWGRHEINSMEVDFLRLLKYELQVDMETIERYVHEHEQVLSPNIM